MIRKTLAILCAMAAGVAMAQEATPSAPPQKPTLVDAAKSARTKRKKSTTKVITNADVKKSKGTLIVREPPPIPATSGAAKVPTLEEHDAANRAKRLADVKVAEAETRVSDLEQELAALELKYYEENDPSHRDGVIKARFEQMQKDLAAAQKRLTDARDERDALDRVVEEPAAP